MLKEFLKGFASLIFKPCPETGAPVCPCAVKKAAQVSYAVDKIIDVVVSFIENISIGSLGNYNYFKSNNLSTTSAKYQPVKDIESQDVNIVSGKSLVVAEANKYNIISAHPEGSEIWPKNISQITLNEGSDKIYFSLCSTKIHEGKVTTVKNFDPQNDKLWFFCSKQGIESQEFQFNKIDNPGYTCIEVRDTAVCLLGDYQFSSLDIGITNKAQVDSIFESAILVN